MSAPSNEVNDCLHYTRMLFTPSCAGGGGWGVDGETTNKGRHGDWGEWAVGVAACLPHHLRLGHLARSLC